MLEQIARQADFSPQWLSYNTKLVHWLRQQEQAGRTLVLVTDFSQQWGEAIASHLELFEFVLQCSRNRVVAANQILHFAHTLPNQNGQLVFVGTRADKPILDISVEGVVSDRAFVKNSSTVLVPGIEHCFHVKQVRWREYLRAMRAHQWLKNSLIFIPLITSHKLVSVHKCPFRPNSASCEKKMLRISIICLCLFFCSP